MSKVGSQFRPCQLTPHVSVQIHIRFLLNKTIKKSKPGTWNYIKSTNNIRKDNKKWNMENLLRIIVKCINHNNLQSIPLLLTVSSRYLVLGLFEWNEIWQRVLGDLMSANFMSKTFWMIISEVLNSPLSLESDSRAKFSKKNFPL